MIELRKNTIEEIFNECPSDILLSVEDDDIGTKLLTKFATSDLSLNDANALGENILHVYSRKCFINATQLLIESHAGNLWEQVNKAGNTPLMVMVQNKMSAQAMSLWNFISSMNDNSQIYAHQNFQGKSIYHICAEFQPDLLLQTIKCLDKESLRSAFNLITKTGDTVLHLCNNEETVLKIFDLLDFSTLDFKIINSNRNNVLHVFCKRDFLGCINRMQIELHKDQFKEMQFFENRNGNNPLMSASISNNSRCLTSLLSTMIYQDYNTVEINHLLHHVNKYGNTLLALTLANSLSLQAAKYLLLELEKKFHNGEEDTEPLKECFKKYLHPSQEVLEILNDAQKSMKKSSTDKCCLWFEVFFTSLLLPLIVIGADIFSDVCLVISYSSINDNGIEKIFQECKDHFNSTSGTSFFCIPYKLQGEPRFFYSLGFLLSPWIYYVVEFSQSRYYRNLAKVSI